MMKAARFPMENSSSIRVSVYNTPEQTKPKRILHSAILPADSSIASPEALQATSRNATVSPPEGEADVTASATVLFVSDDDYLRSTIRAYLEHVGFLVRSCADAARIPELFFRSAQRTPESARRTPESGAAVDLLLFDIHALGATGLRLAVELTCFEPELPVVVIAPPGMEKGDLAGMTRQEWKFLNKPVLLPRLLGIIQSALEPHPPAGAASKGQLRNGKIQGILQ